MAADVELIVRVQTRDIEGQAAIRSLRVIAHDREFADGHFRVTNVEVGVGRDIAGDGAVISVERAAGEVDDARETTVDRGLSRRLRVLRRAGNGGAGRNVNGPRIKETWRGRCSEHACRVVP